MKLPNSTTPKIRFIVNIVYYTILIAIFSLILKYGVPLVMPFVIAFAVAALVQKPTKFITRKVKFLGHKPVAAVMIVLAYGIAGVLISLLCIKVINEVIGFFNYMPAAIQNIADAIETATSDDLDEFFSSVPGFISAPLKEFVISIQSDLPGQLTALAQQFSTQLVEVFGSLGVGSISALVKVIISLPEALVAIIITIIATFFIGMDYDNIINMLINAFPRRMRPGVVKVKQYAVETVFGLLKTYILLMTLTFAELAVGFSLINLSRYEIPYVVPLALIIAIVDILPVLGVGTVLIPWGIICFVIGEWQLGLMILALYGVITVLRNYLEPKIIGEKYGMQPILTLLAIYVGGKLFGVIGIFMLPLTCITIKRLYDVGAIKLWFSDKEDDKKEAENASESDSPADDTEAENNAAEAAEPKEAQCDSAKALAEPEEKNEKKGCLFGRRRKKK